METIETHSIPVSVFKKFRRKKSVEWVRPMRKMRHSATVVSVADCLAPDNKVKPKLYGVSSQQYGFPKRVEQF